MLHRALVPLALLLVATAAAAPKSADSLSEHLVTYEGAASALAAHVPESLGPFTLLLPAEYLHPNLANADETVLKTVLQSLLLTEAFKSVDVMLMAEEATTHVNTTVLFEEVNDAVLAIWEHLDGTVVEVEREAIPVGKGFVYLTKPTNVSLDETFPGASLAEEKTSKESRFYVYAADGRNVNYDVQLGSRSWDDFDWSGVSTPGLLENLLMHPIQWDGATNRVRLEYASYANCNAFDFGMRRLDTMEVEWQRFDYCYTYLEKGCYVQYHWFFGGDVVAKWETTSCPLAWIVPLIIGVVGVILIAAGIGVAFIAEAGVAEATMEGISEGIANSL